MAFFGVTIEEIETVNPIEGADRIQVATIKGLVFNFVIAKDSFKPGDKVLYFPVDSLIPQALAEKLGVAGKLAGSNKDRIKTVKLKGVMSQGIVGPVGLIDGLDDRTPESITQFLGITKYEPPEVVCHGGKLTRHAEGVSTYDIEGADRYPKVVDKLMDQIVFITEKVEGSNWYGGVDAAGNPVVGQRSGAIIPDDVNSPDHTWWKVARDYQLLYNAYRIREDNYKQKSVIFRGEIAGGSIQSNLYKFPKFRIFVFDILVDGQYVDVEKFLKLTSDFGIETAPVLSKDKTLREWLGGKTIKEACHGNSMLGDNLREGIVIKPMTEQYDGILGGRLLIKQRDPIYLAKYGF
jgi:RNA ligase (TIGR02306 family)